MFTILISVLLVAQPAQSVPNHVLYRPPVVAPIVDGFRPPSTFAGAGNRGLEYATDAGEPIWASASGTVVFVGTVGGTNTVSISHSDGLRTTYSGLESFGVEIRTEVQVGTPIGSAGTSFHFGVKAGDGYINPAHLFEASTTAVRLVPIGESGG